MAAAGDFQCRIGADGDIQRHRFTVQAGQVIGDTEETSNSSPETMAGIFGVSTKSSRTVVLLCVWPMRSGETDTAITRILPLK